MYRVQSNQTGLQLQDIMNNELTKVDDWMICNKLSLNVSKTKFMIFAKPNKVIPNISLKIRNDVLEQVNVFNFLGITIDSKMSWKQQVNKISAKISKTAGILSRLKHFLPKQILLNIYNALFMPHINYCILAWGFSPLKRILLLQKKAVRSITCSSYYSHTAPLFKSLKLLTVDDIFLAALLKFYYKLINDCLPIFSNSLIPPGR